MTDRRHFLKSLAAGCAASLAVPSILQAIDDNKVKPIITPEGAGGESRLIVPKNNGLKITGTFLDEISHDIPHQNWGEKEWDLDFQYMKAIGIDTVIVIRSGYRKFITYPSPYLLKKGCYMPSVDLIDMYLRLADKYGMKFYFGLYDSGHYWDTGDMSHEIEDNRYVIDEVWKMYGHHKSFKGWYISTEISRATKGAVKTFHTIGKQCKDISGGLPVFISPWIDGKKAVMGTGKMTRRVKGSLFYGIIAATLIGIPLGVTQVESGWIPISLPKSVAPTFLQFDFTSLLNIKTVLVVISLLLVNIFDTVGTLVGLCYKTGNVRPDGSIPHVSEAMMSDAIGTTCGAMLGSSTITTYVESASGIAEGGRSGLTSFVTGLLFLVALFLAPLFLLIPSAATSGALVIVGVLMLDGIKHIEMTDMSEAFPSFVTVIMMLLCYSIADGVCFGILTFVLTKLLTGKWRDLNITLVVLAVLFVLNFVFG